MIRTIAFCFVLSLASNACADDSPISVARQYANAHAIIADDGQVTTLNDDQLGRDPETSATSYVFAIRRHAKKLLSPEQATKWQSLIDDHSPRLKQFHDDRNVLRAYFFACSWELPTLNPGVERDAKQQELLDWLDIWMRVRQQEQIAQHRLCRDAWTLLSESQRRELQEGSWDQHVKKSTGHTRNYFGDRIVNRALGKPTNKAKFESRSKQFESAHIEIRKALLAAETRYRRATFSLPSLPDQTMLDAWAPVDKAYRAYFLSQAQHIDGLSRVGYQQSSPATREKLLAQPAREFADLDKKIETKLTAGRKLRDLIKTAADH